jgi:hypothetical protein
LFGELEHGGTVTIGAREGALTFSYDAAAAPAPRDAPAGVA